MDLILWRTAEAEENSQDLERRLTAKGGEGARPRGVVVRG